MTSEEERALLSAFPGAIIASDASGRIVFLNPAAERLLGWPTEAAAGRPLSILMPVRMRARHEAGIRRYLETHESRLLGKPVRVPALRMDGTELDVDLMLRLFRRPDGSDFIVATMGAADAEAPAPAGLIELETKLQKRMYQLV